MECKFTVTVRPKPSGLAIHCPERIRVAIPCGKDCATVSYPVPSVENGLLVSCVPPSGSCFPLGVNAVVCTTKDDCGRQTSCSFAVEVVTDQSLPPVIECPKDIVVYTCGDCENVKYPAPVVTGGRLAACSAPSGACFPIGTTAVFCLATNDCGVRSQCRFTITVRPKPPVETDYFSYSQGKLNLLFPDGRIERVSVGGPTRVEVEINECTGKAADNDRNGLDEVNTTMTLLNLVGSSSLGPVAIMLDPDHPSRGQIEEEVNATPGTLDLDPFGAGGCARSFFDVNALFKVGERVFRPSVPLHIVARICHKPPGPGEAYMNLTDQAPIDILDEKG